MNNAMSAAYTLNAVEFSNVRVDLGIYATDELGQAQLLVDIVENTLDRSVAGDRRVIDGRADELGIRNAYEWRRHSDNRST